MQKQEHDITKLPRWAQNEITRLRTRDRKLAEIEEVLHAPPGSFMESHDVLDAVADIVEDRR